MGSERSGAGPHVLHYKRLPGAEGPPEGSSTAPVDFPRRVVVLCVCVSCPLYNASTSYYHDTPSSLGGEEETGGGDTVATNPGQAEQVVDAEPQTDRIHRKQRLGAHTCNMYTAPDTWHLAVFKAFRSELLTSPY